MSDMPFDPSDDAIERYLLEVMDPAERAAFEARLSTDAPLATEVAAMREALASWALSTPVAVPDGLKSRVMAQAGASAAGAVAPVTPIGAAPGARRAPVVPVLLLALAASLALVVKLSNDVKAAQRVRALTEGTVSQLRSQLAHQDSLIAAFTGNDVELVSLVSTGEAQPAVKTWLNRTRRVAMITVNGMGVPEAGKTYQLWYIVAGVAAPIPSATFTPDSTGRAFVDAIPMPDNVAMAGEITTAITIEPVGGSQAPSGAPIFVGKTVAPR